MEFSRQEHWRGSHSLLQGIFPTQVSNLGLLNCRQILYHLSSQERVYRWSLKSPWSPSVYRLWKDHFSLRVFQGRRSRLPPIRAESLLAFQSFCWRDHQYPWWSLLFICVAPTACHLPPEPRVLCPDTPQSGFGQLPLGHQCLCRLHLVSGNTFSTSKRTDFCFLSPTLREQSQSREV